jgi:ADP-heptose:LPS heptosyltransferase
MRLRIPSSEQFLFLANLAMSKLWSKPSHNETVRSVLVVKLDEIGDMATATHCFKLLKDSYPDAILTILCKPFVKNLIENDPYVDEILTDVNTWNTKFDVIVELRGTWKTLFKSLMFLPKMRVSRALIRWRNRGNQLHEVQTNTDTIAPILESGFKSSNPQLYYSDQNSLSVNRYLSQNSIQKFAIFHVGARKKLRQWNHDRFAVVADYLFEKHAIPSLFIGTEDERKDIESVQNHMKSLSYNLSGKFSLAELSYLCSKASIYIGNESGPLQIASSFEIPLIALFGPGVPNVFYPIHPKARIFHHVLACNPCDQIHCVQPNNPCISMISTLDVLGKIDELVTY